MTTDCDDDKEERELPEIASGGAVVIGEGVETRLQRNIKDVPAVSERRDVDEHTAITRGMAEYIAGLSADVNGRVLKFARVEYDYPSREQAAEPVFPAAAIYATEEGEFGAYLSSPVSSQFEVSRGVYVVPINTLYLDELRIEVECQDAEQRIAVRKMLTDAFLPTPGLTGFQLILPHYHNAMAKFTLMKATMPDTPDLVMQGIRPVAYTLAAYVQVYRVHHLTRLVQARTPGTIGPR